ncbi:MAG TPA: hypothetical protein VHQ86_02300 [Candidatus Saccharimonadia bacterium]|nr:hypothetical protein [Candidatus Saccharimonadia bacterium]
MQEFFERCPARIVSITGTRGRGAVVGLVAAIFEEAGRRVWRLDAANQLPALGRIKPIDLVVLELSAQALTGLDTSPTLAVCTGIATADLAGSKTALAAMGNLFWRQQPADVAVYQADNEYAAQIAELSPGQKIPAGRAPGAQVQDGNVVIDGAVICSLSEAGLNKSEDRAVVLVAVTAAWQLVNNRHEAVRRAVLAYRSDSHER